MSDKSEPTYKRDCWLSIDTTFAVPTTKRRSLKPIPKLHMVVAEAVAVMEAKEVVEDLEVAVAADVAAVKRQLPINLT